MSLAEAAILGGVVAVAGILLYLKIRAGKDCCGRK